MGFWKFVENIYSNKKNCPYWGDCGSGVLPFCPHTKRFLANMRSQGVNEGGTYGVFGGGIFLDYTPYQNVEDLAKSDYPKNHAIEELQEETGYSGPIKLTELYVYKDNKKNSRGEPCNFYYWNFLGICPKEFPVSPGEYHRWENGEGSNWFTFDQLMNLQPKHFGLISLLQNAAHKLQSL